MHNLNRKWMLFDIEEVEISYIRPQKSKIQKKIFKNWGTQHKLIIPQLSRLKIQIIFFNFEFGCLIHTLFACFWDSYFCSQNCFNYKKSFAVGRSQLCICHINWWFFSRQSVKNWELQDNCDKFIFKRKCYFLIFLQIIKMNLIY